MACYTDEVCLVIGSDIDARFILSDENNIYFSNWSDSGKLYKGVLSEDGMSMEFTKICDDSISWMAIEDNYIYYKNLLDGGEIYRIEKTAVNAENGEVVTE